jgi:hypothetical protein
LLGVAEVTAVVDGEIEVRRGVVRGVGAFQCLARIVAKTKMLAGVGGKIGNTY